MAQIPMILIFFNTVFTNIQAREDQHIVVAGDFNLVLSSTDAQNRKDSHPLAKGVIQHFCDEFDLTDIWRVMNPDKSQFTWYRLGSDPVFSRLDFYLVSKELILATNSIDIKPKVNSDHCPVVFKLNIEEIPRGPGCWKFNKLFLSDPVFIAKLKEKIKICAETHVTLSPIERWEQIKHTITEFCQLFARQKAKINKNKNKNLLQSLEALNKELIKEPQCSDTINAIRIIKNEQQEINENKIKGQIFRSKARWAREGEKSSKYFFSLERRNYQNKNMKTLEEDGIEYTDQKVILQKQRNFYKRLYTSNKTVHFDLTPEKDEILLTEEQRHDLDLPITINEIYQSLKGMHDNKSPGSDGLSKELYCVLWDTISVHLESLYMQVLEDGRLNWSARRGLITLIPKKGKNIKNLNCWRPLTMLNIDYKLLAKTLAERLKRVLPSIISHEQTGFMEGRNISDNLRKTLEVLTYTKQNNIPAIIMAVDYAKCFDTLEYGSIKGALKYFEFGENFTKWSSVFFNDFSVCTQNYGFTSDYFDKERGCNQGCNISPFFYLLCGEIMARKIKQNSSIKGILIDNIINLISQFADDTALYLEFDINTLNAVIDIFDMIEKQLGLVVSYEKTVLYRIGSLQNTNAKLYTRKNFTWSNDTFTLLGLQINADEYEMITINYDNILLKLIDISENWIHRDLTIMGRVLLINTLMESLYVYKGSVLPDLTDRQIKLIEDGVRRFLWKGKPARIALKTLQLSKQCGGLRLFDIRRKKQALNIAWIPKIEKEIFYRSAFFRNVLLPKNFQSLVWVCNMHEKDLHLITKGQNFWCDVYRSWCNYNFRSPDSADEILNQVIWYNSCIRRDNKPIYSNNLFTNGIVYIHNLFHQEKRQIYTFQEFVTKYGYITDWLSYENVTRSIPQLWKNILKNMEGNINITETLRINELLNQPKPGNFIYKELINDSNLNLHKYYSRWSEVLPSFVMSVPFENYVKCFKYLYKITSITKYQDFQYRLLLGKLVFNEDLHKWHKIDSNLCTFCKQEPESFQHLFHECIKVKCIWIDVQKKLGWNSPPPLVDLILNQFENPKRSISDFIILFTKQYIYKSRCLNETPSVDQFNQALNYEKRIEIYNARMSMKLSQVTKKWDRLMIEYM